MAEGHPPSPMREGHPCAQEIAGQARNDGKGLNVVLPFCVSSQVIRRNAKKVTASLKKSGKMTNTLSGERLAFGQFQLHVNLL